MRIEYFVSFALKEILAHDFDVDNNLTIAPIRDNAALLSIKVVREYHNEWRLTYSFYHNTGKEYRNGWNISHFGEFVNILCGFIKFIKNELGERLDETSHKYLDEFILQLEKMICEQPKDPNKVDLRLWKVKIPKINL